MEIPGGGPLYEILCNIGNTACVEVLSLRTLPTHILYAELHFIALGQLVLLWTAVDRHTWHLCSNTLPTGIGSGEPGTTYQLGGKSLAPPEPSRY